MTPEATLVITTYNRAELLREALHSVAASQGIARDFLEVVVVDNNCVDHTAQVIVEVRDGGFPFELIHEKEPNQGLSHARNRGIARARGKFIAFMDDDQLVDAGYISNLSAVFRESGAACAGGKIKYYNAENIPPWLEPLIADVGQIDLGDEPVDLGGSIELGYLKGGNIAFTRDILDRIGGFNTDLGRSGDSLLGGEEVDIQGRVAAAGGRIVYDPRLIQYHLLRPERWHKRYWRKHAFDWGRSEYEMEKANWAQANRFMGVPRTVLLYLFTGSLRRYVAAWFTFDGARIFNHERAIWRRLGYIAEARRQYRQGGGR
ncbi:MAG: glycosyltransferase [Hyphomicrobiales bacterium]|nr:glycosyltransferase [Hyphomicrobiales bacterium]MCP5372077.1 glycosyltransferase [Hyphomicrobiales bacterium]